MDLTTVAFDLLCAKCGQRASRATLFQPCEGCGGYLCHPDSKEERAVKSLEKAIAFIRRSPTLRIDLHAEPPGPRKS